MTLNIPEIGTVLVLAQDWVFSVYPEHRNTAFLQAMGKPFLDPGTGKEYVWYPSALAPREITLPAGVSLKVDRIYIRKGNAKYSSVSFWAKRPGERKNIGRFWAKLEDVNSIVYTAGEE